MTGVYISLIAAVTFLFLERFLRFSNDARTLKTTFYDKGTTARLRFALFSSVIIIIGSYFLNRMNILRIDTPAVFISGLILTVSGITLRIIATLTLREYYTRTLMITENHRVVKHGVYRIIRNPGYLGTMTFLTGCGILTGNLAAMLLILLIVPYSFIKRLLTEEQMLMEHFGNDYREYMKTTYRLIPFLF
jgi:protein-S-isoprenylcysteine O-methyltransferase Ste14